MSSLSALLTTPQSYLSLVSIHPRTPSFLMFYLILYSRLPLSWFGLSLFIFWTTFLLVFFTCSVTEYSFKHSFFCHHLLKTYSCWRHASPILAIVISFNIPGSSYNCCSSLFLLILNIPYWSTSHPFCTTFRLVLLSPHFRNIDDNNFYFLDSIPWVFFYTQSKRNYYHCFLTLQLSTLSLDFTR